MGCTASNGREIEEFQLKGNIKLKFMNLLKDKEVEEDQMLLPIKIVLSNCRKYIYAGFINERLFKYSLKRRPRPIFKTKISNTQFNKLLTAKIW